MPVRPSGVSGSPLGCCLGSLSVSGAPSPQLRLIDAAARRNAVGDLVHNDQMMLSVRRDLDIAADAAGRRNGWVWPN
jgi:hypothetical protein